LRKLLFNKNSINRPKSECAKEALLFVNPNMNITAYNLEVHDNNDFVFNNEFWESLDVIIAAVDSGKARAYLCSIAQYYNKIYIEGGTNAMLGSQSCFIPSKTSCYEYSEEKIIDKEADELNCLAKVFHYHTNHTIQWAGDKFRELFDSKVGNINMLERHIKEGGTAEDKVELLNLFAESIESKDSKNFARFLFNKWYKNDIEDLLIKNPPDSLEKGVPFWSRLRILPKILVFDNNNYLHIELINRLNILISRISINNIKPIELEKDDIDILMFISVISRLEAECFNLEGPDSILQIQQNVSEFVPSIITTTTSIAGFCCNQLYKIVGNSSHTEYDSINLNSVNNIIFRYQIKASTFPDSYPNGIIDDIVINETSTLKSIMENIKESVQKYGKDPDSVLSYSYKSNKGFEKTFDEFFDDKLAFEELYGLSQCTYTKLKVLLRVDEVDEVLLVKCRIV